MSLSLEQRSPTDPHTVAGAAPTPPASELSRLAGLSALLAGLCYVPVGIFHPPNVPSSVTSTRWEIVMCWRAPCASSECSAWRGSTPGKRRRRVGSVSSASSC